MWKKVLYILNLIRITLKKLLQKCQNFLKNYLSDKLGNVLQNSRFDAKSTLITTKVRDL